MTDLLQEQRLRRLELTVTRRLDGLLRGQYAGLFPGAGTEVSGSREYRPGEDEVRRMDWAVTARTGLPHVRETIADRELTVWVMVDATPSMDFGTALVEKRELAVSAVAAVGFLTAGHGNRLGASVMSAAGVRRFPARTGRAHLLSLLRALLALPRGEPGTAPPLADSLDGLGRALRRRGLVVVVSDFLDTSWSWELPLRRLALRHQVIAVEVMDPRELTLPNVGVLTVIDPETGRRRDVSTASRRVRTRFAAAAAAQKAEVRTAIRRTGAAHLPLRTDRDWVADIVRHVHTQRKLALGGTRP
jgi:uncharacterized protein (DUF58 family)